jgi:hypothetical protein
MTNLLGLAGYALLPIGLAAIWWPLGLIALGVEFLFIASVMPDGEPQ